MEWSNFFEIGILDKKSKPQGHTAKGFDLQKAFSSFAILINQIDQDKNCPGNYDNISNFAVFSNDKPVVLEVITHKSEESVPDGSADDSIYAEFPDAHFSHTGRDRNQMSDYGNEAAYEYGFVAVFAEKAFGQFQMMFIKEKIFAEFSDEWPSAPGAGVV